MGILSRIGNAIIERYNAVDRAVGGYLPGGSTPQQVSQSKSSSPQASSSASAAPTNSTSTSYQNNTVSSSGSNSSGGSTISGINLPQQSTTPLPYQTGGTSTDLAPQVPSSVKNVNVSATYGSGASSSKPASASATGASGSALNQGGGPASPSSSGSGGGSGAVMTAATGPNLDKPYDVRDSMSFGDKYASVDKNLFGGLLPGGTKLSRNSISAGIDNVRDAAQQATGTGQYSSPKPITAIGNLLDPLDVFGSTKTKGDVKSADISPGGTGIYNPQTGQYDPWVTQKGQTGYERLKEQAFLNPDVAKNPAQLATETFQNVIGELRPQFESRASDIAAGYQSKIDAGQLTVDQATPLYKADISALQSQFQTQAEQLYDQRLGPKISASQKFGQQFAEFNQPLYPRISTTVTTAGLVAASFGGGSSIAAVRAASGAANALIAVEGASNVGEGIANKNYVQAALGAAAFGLGTYGALRYAANEVTIAQIEGATSKTPRVLYGSRTELRENYFQDISGYKQSTSSATAYTRETVFSEFNPQTNTFKIISGSSETTVKTTDFWTGRTMFVGSYRTFEGAGKVFESGRIGAQSVPGLSVSQEGFTGSVSAVKTTQQYSYRFMDSLQSIPSIRSGGSVVIQKFGAESQLQGDFIKSRSGQLVQSPYKIFELQGGGKVFQEQAGIYKVDTFSILKFKGAGSPTEIYFEPSASSGLRGNLPSSGSGLASQSAASIVPGISVAPLAAEQTLKSATQAITSSAAENIFAASSARSASLYAGTGQYERTDQYQMFAPALSQRDLQGFMQPPIVDVFPGVGQTGGQIPSLAPALAQTPMMDQLQSPVLQQDFAYPGITPGSSVPFNPFIDLDLVGPGLPSLKGFEAGELGMSPIPKGKQRMKYTPDFEALVFGIKGKAPKGGEAPSPFASRPITKGFSFAFSEGPGFGDMLKNLQEIPGFGKLKRRRK